MQYINTLCFRLSIVLLQHHCLDVLVAAPLPVCLEVLEEILKVLFT